VFSHDYDTRNQPRSRSRGGCNLVRGVRIVLVSRVRLCWHLVFKPDFLYLSNSGPWKLEWNEPYSSWWQWTNIKQSEKSARSLGCIDSFGPSPKITFANQFLAQLTRSSTTIERAGIPLLGCHYIRPIAYSGLSTRGWSWHPSGSHRGPWRPDSFDSLTDFATGCAWQSPISSSSAPYQDGWRPSKTSRMLTTKSPQEFQEL